MEEIINRITKLEEELKKEREINRILQLQISDMNEEMEKCKNNETIQIIKNQLESFHNIIMV